MDHTIIRTRKLTINHLKQVDAWLDEHLMGSATIRGTHYKKYIQAYIQESEGNRPIHQLKVTFFNETDARRFLMVWG